MNPLALHTFATLSLHAKIHDELDEMQDRYHDAIARIEREEIRQFDNETRYAELETLKRELLAIKFWEKEKRTTSPSP